MKISQEVWEFAAKQNAAPETFLAAQEAEKGLEEMSQVYNERWRELYIERGARQHN